MKTFDCRYAMYLHHRGVKSGIRGENIVDAIKNRNQTAILVEVTDEDGTVYVVREHEEERNSYFDHYWINKETEEVLYDEWDKEEKIIIETPIDITKTTTDSGWISPEGLFYECGFEQHRYLAISLNECKIAPDVTIEEFGYLHTSAFSEGVLELRGWVKISSGDVRYSQSKKLTNKQKETIKNYFQSKGKQRIKVWDRFIDVDDFMSDDYL